jgi:hypothetical protein
MVQVTTNALSGPGAGSQHESQGDPESKQRIRVAPTGAQGTSAMRMTPQWTTGMREILLQKNSEIEPQRKSRFRAHSVVSGAPRLTTFQRPAPSHVSSIAPRPTRRGDDHMARGRRGGLKIFWRRLITILISQSDKAVARSNAGSPVLPTRHLLGRVQAPKLASRAFISRRQRGSASRWPTCSPQFFSAREPNECGHS